VHRLRVILLREPDDVRLADLNAAEVDELADVEILVVAGQGRTTSSRNDRISRSLNAGLSIRTRQV